MSAPTLQDVKTWRGEHVFGPEGEKLGTLENLYLDRDTGEPTFASIKTGLFGMRESLVPIDAAERGEDGIRVPFDKATIKDAPNIDVDEELSPEEEQRLYAHYGRAEGGLAGGGGMAGGTGTGRGTSAGDGIATGRDAGTERDVATGRDGDAGDADGRGLGGDAMTRSEEELRVGTASRETGRARLRKYIVTEEVQTTVPVEREELRVEREPITDANREAAMSGPEMTESEHEVTLHAQEPVVEKRVVPKERVRLEKDATVDEVEVNDQVRKERIEAEGDASGDRDVR